MHDDELEIDEPLVRRLLTDQFPEWAGLPLRRVEPAGTDNAIFRLGEDRMVRLARRKGSTRLGGKESDWLPRLAPLVPLEIPVPVAQGRPTGEYPWFWDVFTWVEGTPTSFGDRRAYAEWKEQLGRLRDTLAHDGVARTGRASFARGCQNQEPAPHGEPASPTDSGSEPDPTRHRAAARRCSK